MAFIKTGNIKNAIAKQGGFYSVKGEKLKAAKLTQAEIDEWNGVKSVKPAVVAAVIVDDTLEVAATFNDIDTDGDGVISEEELVVAANNTTSKKKKK